MKEDLIPLNKRTPEEVKEITSKAGKASGASRRRKKQLYLNQKKIKLTQLIKLILQDIKLQKIIF